MRVGGVAVVNEIATKQINYFYNVNTTRNG